MEWTREHDKKIYEATVGPWMEPTGFALQYGDTSPLPQYQKDMNAIVIAAGIWCGQKEDQRGFFVGLALENDSRPTSELRDISKGFEVMYCGSGETYPLALAWALYAAVTDEP